MLKDIQMQKFSSQEIFSIFGGSLIMGLLVSEIQKKIWVSPNFVSEIINYFKAYRENYPNFEILVHIIQHGLQGFIMRYRR